jgi:pimeloyl-ACP methyl ester carboxylesterase
MLCALVLSALPFGAFAVAQGGGYQFGDTPIAWSDCPEAGPIETLQCATYTVPLDYRAPDGETIQLALRRVPAGGSERIGTLFFNPGGPGGTGSGQFPAWYGQFPEQVRAQFDIVSWDPRGVGESTSVQCFDSPEAEQAVIGEVGAFPLTLAEQEAYATDWQAFADACASRQPELLAHVSTADTARDLEQLRIASGDEDLNYWGVSYGTFLGATYANMFPDRIRTLVLDGNLSPLNWTAGGDTDPQWSIGQRIGSQQSGDVFALFLQLCTTAGPDDCAFAAETLDLTTQKWTDLLNRLAQEPLVIEGRDGPVLVTLSLLVSQVSSGLDIVWPINGEAGWQSVASSIDMVYDLAMSTPVGVAGTPVASPAADATTDASPVAGMERYAGGEQSLAVSCGDVARPARERMPSLTADAEFLNGYFGLATLYADYPCTFWSVKAADPYHGPWTTPLSASPLVVNTTHDPSTPIGNAEEMAELLPSSTLLTVNGYGHTSLLNTSTCANDAVASYLLTTRPPTVRHCAQDRQPFED